MQTKTILLFSCRLITLFLTGTTQMVWGDWVSRYDGPAAQVDNARAVAVDSEGNVYVTGETQGPKRTFAYVTIKYAPNGSEIWANRYEGPSKGNHKACAIALDSSGNILVTGSSMGLKTRSDLLTLKYDPQGEVLWERRFNGAKNSSDVARSIAVDAEDNVYVAGLAGSKSILMVKYAPDGSELWTREHKLKKSGVYPAPSMGVDSDGNVYVAAGAKSGGRSYRTLILKFSSAGEVAWESWYAGVANRDNRPNAMVVDPSGHVHVAGTRIRESYSSDYLVLKLDPAGSLLWEAKYRFGSNDMNAAYAMVLDGFGNVHVSGTSYRIQADNFEIGSVHWRTVTVKYDAGGNLLWEAPYAGGMEGMDDYVIPHMAADAAGNVYVTRALGGNDTSQDYVTLKYGPMGNQEWVKRYNGDGSGADFPCGMAVGLDTSVYVVGRSKGLGSFDFATVKYNQP